MPNAGYILAGDLTLHDRASGVTHTYHTGESFAESVNTEHRGEAGPNGAVLLITYSGIPRNSHDHSRQGREAGILIRLGEPKQAVSSARIVQNRAKPPGDLMQRIVPRQDRRRRWCIRQIVERMLYRDARHDRRSQSPLRRPSAAGGCSWRD